MMLLLGEVKKWNRVRCQIIFKEAYFIVLYYLSLTPRSVGGASFASRIPSLAHAGDPLVSGVRAYMAREDAVDVAWSRRDIPSPASEPSMLIDGLDPLGEEYALGPVAVGVLTLGLQHEHVA